MWRMVDESLITDESQPNSSQSRLSILDMTSPGKRTVTGKMKTVESKTLDSAIAEVFYEKTLSFNVAHTLRRLSLSHIVEKCIELGQQHPGRKYKAPNRMRICGVFLDSAYITI